MMSIKLSMHFVVWDSKNRSCWHTFKYFNRIRNRVPNLGTDSREKGIHFIGSRELNIKRVARDRSCSVVMNLTCFNELIEYTNWCCLSVDIIQ